MQGIDDALKAVGDDTIQHLFEFVEMQCELADNPLDEHEITHTGFELGKAIFAYAKYKERICRE